MKIGILSMQRIINYGSFFQAYSLKTVLESMGHKVFFVDYKPCLTIDALNQIKASKWAYLRKRKSQIKRIIKHIRRVLGITKSPWDPYFIPCYKMLGLSATYHYRRKCDVLIIGSDEVFNCLQKNEDVGYSMELFGKRNRAKKLISYAASFGDTTMERLAKYQVSDEIAHYLNGFDAISVRDKNSAAIVQNLCGKQPFQHLDPVLIGRLEERKWGECKYDHFLLVYGYSKRFTAEEGEAIMSFARNNNLQVLALGNNQSFGDIWIRCRPDELFGYFSKAEYVVTDTFHGTIFSVLHHKPLAVFCRMSDSTAYSNENKLLDLLDKLELQDQLVKNATDIGSYLCRKIDYAKIDRIIDTERRKALAYLRAECGGKDVDQAYL